MHLRSNHTSSSPSATNSSSTSFFNQSMFRPSLRVALTVPLVVLLVLSCLLPVLLTFQAADKTIQASVQKLVIETVSNIRVTVQRQTEVSAATGMSIRNWTRIYGFPYTNAITHRNYVRKTTGQFLYGGFYSSRVNAFRRFADGSAQRLVQTAPDALHWQLCQSKTGDVWKVRDDLPEPNEPEPLENCSFATLNMTTGELLDPAVSPLARVVLNSTLRTFWNGTIMKAILDAMLAVPVLRTSYLHIGPYFIPESNFLSNSDDSSSSSSSTSTSDVLMLSNFMMAFKNQTSADIPLVGADEGMPTNFYATILRDLLPTSSGRAYLVDSTHRVVAFSSGRFFETINTTDLPADDPRRTTTTYCFSARQPELRACLFDMETYPPYAMLNIAHKEATTLVFNPSTNSTSRVYSSLDSQSVSTVTSGSDGDDDDEQQQQFLWYRQTIRFSPTVAHQAFVFIPVDFYMADINEATLRTIIIVACLVLLGVVITVLITRPILHRIEDLAEQMSRDPFDPSFKLAQHSSNSNSNDDDDTKKKKKRNRRKNRNKRRHSTQKDKNKHKSRHSTQDNHEVNNDSDDENDTNNNSNATCLKKFFHNLGEIVDLEVSFAEFRAVIEQLRSFMPESAMIVSNRSFTSASLSVASARSLGSGGSIEASSPSASASASTSKRFSSSTTAGRRPRSPPPPSSSGIANDDNRRLKDVLASLPTTTAKGVTNSDESEEESATATATTVATNNNNSTNYNNMEDYFRNAVPPPPHMVSSLESEESSSWSASAQPNHKNINSSLLSNSKKSGLKDKKKSVRFASAVLKDHPDEDAEDAAAAEQAALEEAQANSEFAISIEDSFLSAEDGAAESDASSLAGDNDDDNNNNNAQQKASASSTNDRKTNNKQKDATKGKEEEEEKQHRYLFAVVRIDLQLLAAQQIDDGNNSSSTRSFPSSSLGNNNQTTSANSSHHHHHHHHHHHPQHRSGSAGRSPRSHSLTTHSDSGTASVSLSGSLVSTELDEELTSANSKSNLVDCIEFVVETLQDVVVRPLGAHIVEYRNDFFILALRLSRRRMNSRLALRFVRLLIEASEILHQHYFPSSFATTTTSSTIPSSSINNSSSYRSAANSSSRRREMHYQHQQLADEEVELQQHHQQHQQQPLAVDDGTDKNATDDDITNAFHQSNNNTQHGDVDHPDHHHQCAAPIINKDSQRPILSAGLSIGFSRVLLSDDYDIRKQKNKNKNNNNNNTNNNNNKTAVAIDEQTRQRGKNDLLRPLTLYSKAVNEAYRIERAMKELYFGCNDDHEEEANKSENNKNSRSKIKERLDQSNTSNVSNKSNNSLRNELYDEDNNDALILNALHLPHAIAMTSDTQELIDVVSHVVTGSRYRQVALWETPTKIATATTASVSGSGDAAAPSSTSPTGRVPRNLFSSAMFATKADAENNTTKNRNKGGSDKGQPTNDPAVTENRPFALLPIMADPRSTSQSPANSQRNYNNNNKNNNSSNDGGGDDDNNNNNKNNTGSYVVSRKKKKNNATSSRTSNNNTTNNSVASIAATLGLPKTGLIDTSKLFSQMSGSNADGIDDDDDDDDDIGEYDTGSSGDQKQKKNNKNQKKKCSKKDDSDNHSNNNSENTHEDEVDHIRDNVSSVKGAEHHLRDEEEKARISRKKRKASRRRKMMMQMMKRRQLVSLHRIISPTVLRIGDCVYRNEGTAAAALVLAEDGGDNNHHQNW